MDTSLVDQVVDIAQRVVASGAISANGHGNVSVRVPGAEELYFTAGPSLRDHPPSAAGRPGAGGGGGRGGGGTCPPGRPGRRPPPRRRPWSGSGWTGPCWRASCPPSRA